MFRLQALSLVIVTILIYSLTFAEYANGSKAIRVAVVGRFKANLEPHIAYNPYELSVGACSHPRLFNLLNSGAIEGDLAKSWSFGKEGRSLKINLRADSAFTAKDVSDWINFLLKNQKGGFHRELLAEILTNPPAAHAINQTELELRLKEPYPALVYLLSSIEFQVPRKFWPKEYVPNLRLIAKVENRSYDVLENKTGSKIIEIDVLRGDQTLISLVKSRGYDVVIGVTPVQHAALTKLPFNVKTFNGLNSMFFSFRKSDRQFEDLIFRAELARRLKSAAVKFSENNPIFAIQDRLVPKGVLPPDYYMEHLGSIPRMKEAELARRVKKPLDMWISSDSFPRSFVREIREALSIEGKPFVRIDYLPFRRAYDSRKAFDIVITDAGSFFPDPDSFLRTWSLTMPETLFPFPGRELLSSLRNKTLGLNTVERLSVYSKLIKKFEEERWVVPIFLLPEIVLVAKGSSINLPAYRYVDNVCRALSGDP